MFFGILTNNINGFWVLQALVSMVLNGLVRDHWSNDEMVSMYRSGLLCHILSCRLKERERRPVWSRFGRSKTLFAGKRQDFNEDLLEAKEANEDNLLNGN